MKKISVVCLVLLFSVVSTFSVDVNLTDLEKQFGTMGDDLSGAIASNATSGLTWSDAYIGNFPHFGVGIFVGASIIPLEAFSDVLNTIDSDASLPSELSSLGGLPVPVFGIDGRIGGFGIPFDVGFKFAMLPSVVIGGATFDYSLIGGDFRYAIIDGDALLPNISVGVGFSRLTSKITIAGILEDDYMLYTLPSAPDGVIEIGLKNPDLEYGWESNVIDFKVQISKGFLFITPYLGLDAAYGMTKVGGGLKTTLIDQTGEPITSSAAIAAAESAGFTTDGFEVYTNITDWGFKIFGGTSFNIAVVKIDVTANYDPLAKSFGGQLGFRVQI